MDELKILIEALTEMPTLAIWVVVMYFFFKITVVGSIYGVLRFAIGKLHSYGMEKKEPSKVIQQHNITLDGKLITSLRDNPEEFLRLMERIKSDEYKYIFESDIDRVHEALDMYENSELLNDS